MQSLPGEAVFKYRKQYDWHVTQLTPEAALAHERRIRKLSDEVHLGWTPYNFLITYRAVSQWACHTEDELYRWMSQKGFDTRGPHWTPWEQGVRSAFLHKKESAT